METAPYTEKQEIANRQTHGIGDILSIVGIPILLSTVVRNGYETPVLLAFALFCAALLAVFVPPAITFSR